MFNDKATTLVVASHSISVCELTVHQQAPIETLRSVAAPPSSDTSTTLVAVPFVPVIVVFVITSKSESTKTFFDALQSRVNVAIDSTAAANERVKNLLNANIANKAKARTSDIIEEMNVAFNINKYRGLTEGDPDIISKSVQKSIDSFENQRETVFQKFDDAYNNPEYADIELGISSMLNNL